MKGTIRIWLDELERLPEYSSSKPSGVCPFKSWKRRVRKPGGGLAWIVGMYTPIQGITHELYTRWFDVVLLQGPRREGDPLRLKTACTRAELREVPRG